MPVVAPAPAERPRKPRRRKARGGQLTLTQRFLKWIGLAGLAGGLVLAGLIALVASGLPATDKLFSAGADPSISVVDRSGRMIAVRGASQGAIIPVGEMPAFLPQAVLAIEDRRFYDHFGIDLIGLVRALAANVEAGRIVQGGSTLTQQLAKNLFLNPDRTVMRKAEEALLALWLEIKFSKDEILTLYLNRVYFGAGTYGVEAAAQRYFNVSARDVTLKEAAILAALLKAPSRLSPVNDEEAAESRAALVLDSMEAAGFITAEEHKSARKERPRIARSYASPGAEYFSDYVLEQLPGFSGPLTQDLIVETTLDLDLQLAAETAVERVMATEGAKAKAGEAALAAIDVYGAVRALVGGRDYGRSQFNRAFQARRPPGSAFKPFVFLAALERGYRPDSLVLDAPVQLGTWAPENYKNNYEGDVTLTRAMAASLNSVAVRLMGEIGPEAVAEVAARLGIQSPLAISPSLALGASEVNLVELTGAYLPFATGGFSALPHAITRITTRKGEVLYERASSGPLDVVAPLHAAEMTLMLREVIETGTGKKAKLADREAAGKTGTSQDFRDAWFVGYTSHLIAGVWVGNDGNAPMDKITGGTLPAEIWQSFMREAGKTLPPEPLPALAALPAPSEATPAPLAEETPVSGASAPDPFQPVLDGLIDPQDGKPPVRRPGN